jgi:hypothetical protein
VHARLVRVLVPQAVQTWPPKNRTSGRAARQGCGWSPVSACRSPRCKGRSEWPRHPTGLCCAVAANGLRSGAETCFALFLGCGTARKNGTAPEQPRELPRFASDWHAQPGVGFRGVFVRVTSAKPTIWRIETWEIRARFFRARVKTRFGMARDAVIYRQRASERASRAGRSRSAQRGGIMGGARRREERFGVRDRAHCCTNAGSGIALLDKPAVAPGA